VVLFFHHWCQQCLGCSNSMKIILTLQWTCAFKGMSLGSTEGSPDGTGLVGASTISVVWDVESTVPRSLRQVQVIPATMVPKTPDGKETFPRLSEWMWEMPGPVAPAAVHSPGVIRWDRAFPRCHRTSTVVLVTVECKGDLVALIFVNSQILICFPPLVSFT
jgi:hypothetical protein